MWQKCWWQWQWPLTFFWKYWYPNRTIPNSICGVDQFKCTFDIVAIGKHRQWKWLLNCSLDVLKLNGLNEIVFHNQIFSMKWTIEFFFAFLLQHFFSKRFKDTKWFFLIIIVAGQPQKIVLYSIRLVQTFLLLFLARKAQFSSRRH